MPMSYTTLIAGKNDPGSIKYFVRHTEVPSEYILERAQDAIYEILRVREMITKSDGTLTDGSSTLALPADFVEPLAINFRGEYRGPITILDHQHYESAMSEEVDGSLYEGQPSFCTFDKTHFHFDTEADRNYLYRLWYIQKPAYLTSGSPTNFLTTRFPNMLESMCRHFAWEHRDNEAEAAKALEKAMGFIDKANEAYDMLKQQIQMEAYWRQ